jgi:Tfp pilus assembly protein PilF
MADAKMILGTYRVEPPQNAYAAAKAAVGRALELNPDLGEAHAVFAAAVLYFEWDWASAERHFARAVALDASSPRVHQWYSRYLSARGRHDLALWHAARAVALAPGSASARTDLGTAAFYARRWAQAIADCEEALALLPQFLPARMCAAAAAAESGALPVAARHLAALAQHDTPDDVQASAHPIALASHADEFWTARLEGLRPNLGDPDCLLRGVTIAGALAHTGQRAGALDWLEQAANHRTDMLIFAAVDPAFDTLAGDRRFMKVLQRVGYPETR